MSFKTTKDLNLPTLSFKEAKLGESVVVKFLDRIYEGKQIRADGKEREKPADLATVLNFADGEKYTLVVPAVVKSTLDDAKDYIGKWHRITYMGPVAGKRYKQYKIEQGEVDESGIGKDRAHARPATVPAAPVSEAEAKRAGAK